MRRYGIVTAQLWAVIAKPVSLEFVRMCVCCLQVTHRTADDHNAFLLLECSWLSFYRSPSYDSHILTPFLCIHYFSLHSLAISFHQCCLQALQVCIPRLHNSLPRSILPGRQGNDTQQIKGRGNRTFTFWGAFHTWLCFVRDIVPEKLGHQQQTGHPAQV